MERRGNDWDATRNGLRDHAHAGGVVRQGELSRDHFERPPGVESHAIEEAYRCNAAGVIEVSTANLTAGYAKTYRVH